MKESASAAPIRIGMLSFAHYHANFWAEAFQAEPGVELSVIWDDDALRGRDAGSRFGVAFEPDLARALAACEAVAICSETSRHVPLVEAAALAGCAILCEKPIAVSVAEADRIAAAVGTGGVLFMQSFPKRFDPVSHALRDLLREGALGRIHLVRIRHGHFYGLQPDFPSRWYAQRALGGGGALLDEGVHGADLLCWLFGMPESVVATVSSAVLGLDVEDGGTALFRYADGMTAELTASFLFAAADSSIEAYGTRGTALVAGVDLASRDITSSGFLRIYREGEGERRWNTVDVVPRFKLGRFHHQNAIAFARCLREGTEPPITLQDGRNALLLIERAYEAARTGRRQCVETG